MSNKKCSDGCIFYCAKTITVVKTLLETASLLSETMQFLRNCSEKVEYSLVKGKNAKAKSRKEGSIYAEKVFSSLPIIHNKQKFASISYV